MQAGGRADEQAGGQADSVEDGADERGGIGKEIKWKEGERSPLAVLTSRCSA